MKRKIINMVLMAAMVLSMAGCDKNLTANKADSLIESSLSAGMLSATYSMNYNENIYCIPYQITFNSDGNCVIIKEEYEYLSATYKVFDNGQYVIEIPMLFTSWIAEFDEDILKVQGTGITSGGNWAEMQRVDEVQKKNETYQTSVLTETVKETTVEATELTTTTETQTTTTTIESATTTAISSAIETSEATEDVDYSNFVIENGVLIKCVNPVGRIVIPDTVIAIGKYAFKDADELTEVIIPDSVTKIDGCAFFNCSHLTKISMSKNITSIGAYAFQFCLNLTEITLPESLTVISDGAFYGCNIEELIIPDNVSLLGRTALNGVETVIHKGIYYYSYNQEWIYKVINEGALYTPPYFDSDGTLIWQDYGYDTYEIYVIDSEGAIRNAKDICYSNNSVNYANKMREAIVPSGWYSLEIYGIPSPGLKWFIGSIDYYFEG